MKEVLLTSSALILALLVLRRLFRKVLSRRVQYALWGLVLLRLLVPASLPAADFSLLTAAEPVTARVEALYLAPDRMTIGRTDGGYVWGVPNTPKMAVGPATPDNSRTFLSRDARGNEVEITENYKRQILLADLLPPIWYGGMAIMAGWLVLSNLLFWRKLREARTPYPVEGFSLPVYLVERGLPSPCLFGLFRPAIYLTPAALQSPDRLRHVLAHEETHARHLDPLWSLLRAVCLAVYWFDPLVWWAALASRTDCELACDEGALRRLG
ncbi:MAG: M56 family metallopeptidase, partial [Oscillibacter sp.]|nr:M56 family metallopeptidase [Oscillibacter sp.]